MPADFHTDFTILYYHRQCTKVPVSPYPYQHYILFFFPLVAILTGMR